MRLRCWRRLHCASCLPATVVVVGCGTTAARVQLAPQPEPVRLVMKPGVMFAGSSALMRVESPGADSIAIESLNGLDRWGSNGPRLSARVGSDLGDRVPVQRFARRERGRLLEILKKPVKVTVCRQRTCREYYHEVPVKLAERNQRSVALTAAWGTAVSKRTLTGSNRSVLLEEVVNNSIQSLQAELVAKALSARVQGFYSSREHGGSLDLSHALFGQPGNGFRYGVALHLAAAHDKWLLASRRPGLTGRMTYQASIGPSIMMRGLTASSQIGLSTDGRETLQVLSTYLSINGDLTAVRTPVTVVLEKTFALGGSGIMPRRRDRLDRVTLGVSLVRDLALRMGVSSRWSAWPGVKQGNDLKATELHYTIGGQYTLSW